MTGHPPRQGGRSITPLRVVYVSTLEHGGPVSHLLDLAPHVAAAGADVRVVAASEAVAAAFRRTGVAATAVPVRSKWDLRGVLDLWPAVAGASVVHTQDRRAGLFARPLGRLRGALVVHTYHGLPEDIAVRVGRTEPPPGPAPSRLRRLWLFAGYLRIEAALARLGAVVAPSLAMAEFLAGAGLPRRRIHVLASGIDVRRRAPGPVHHPPVVVAAANLERWKGVDLLVEAVAGLDVRLEVYGDGADRARLEALARRLGADVRFHGRVPDVRDRLADADLFVLPSRAENLPISVLEAMAAALPVVATRVGGVPELVEDWITGRVVEPDDPAALAAAIEEVLGNEPDRVAMGRAGAARVAERFDAAAAGARMLKLYGELCASSR